MKKAVRVIEGYIDPEDTDLFHWAKVVFNIPVIYPNKTSVLKQKVKVILSVEAIHEATKKGGVR